MFNWSAIALCVAVIAVSFGAGYSLRWWGEERRPFRLSHFSAMLSRFRSLCRRGILRGKQQAI